MTCNGTKEISEASLAFSKIVSEAVANNCNDGNEATHYFACAATGPLLGLIGVLRDKSNDPGKFELPKNDHIRKVALFAALVMANALNIYNDGDGTNCDVTVNMSVMQSALDDFQKIAGSPNGVVSSFLLAALRDSAKQADAVLINFLEHKANKKLN